MKIKEIGPDFKYSQCHQKRPFWLLQNRLVTAAWYLSFPTWGPVSDGKMIASIADEKSKTYVMGTRLQHFTEDPIKTAQLHVVAPQNYFYKVMGTCLDLVREGVTSCDLRSPK